MKLFLGLITPLAAYAIITLLHLIIPVKRIRGYVKNEITGEVMNYRTNGKFVLLASILIWFLLGGMVAMDRIYGREQRAQSGG